MSMKVRQREFWFNDAHNRPLPDRPIYVDGFAGGGGASEGFRMGIGRAPDVAINHDKDAIAMHMANHPQTKHYCENIWDVDPETVTEGRQVAAAWFSPDCTHHSKARGSKPVKKNIRGLAWVVVRWAEMPLETRPRVIYIENVEEFLSWGPVDRVTQKPIKEKAGVTFELWVWKLRELGYNVEWRILTASDFGAPTTRKRLFIIARCDGQPIVWPEPTHGSPKQIAKEVQKSGSSRRQPWRTAAEILDWSIPCPSIFLTPEEAKAQGCIRPLADKTLHRIAEGIRRFVIESDNPFIIRACYGSDHFRGQSIDKPLATVTGTNGHALWSPTLAPFTSAGQQGGSSRRADEPHRTVCASPKDCHTVVTPTVVPVEPQFCPHCGKNNLNNRLVCRDCGREAYLVGQVSDTEGATVAPFVTSSAYTGSTGRGKYIYEVDEPIRTMTSTCDKVLVTPTLVQTGYGEAPGQSPRCLDLQAPLGTVVAGGGKHAVVAPHISRMFGASVGSDCESPIGTQTAENKSALVSAFIAKHFGGVTGIPADQPFPTITTVGTQNQLVTANLIKNNHGQKQWFDVEEPVRTVVAQGTHHALVECRIQQVRAFLMKYYGSGGQWNSAHDPAPTITAKDRLCLGIVLIAGEPWQIIDIGMRMLTPRELFNAQGFRSDYQIETTYIGKPASKRVQVARCGNSVCPHVAAALVMANSPVLAV